MRIARSLIQIAEEAQRASNRLRLLSTEEKNQAILAIAKALDDSQASILQANDEDVKNSDLSDSMRDRLNLSGRLEGIIDDVIKIAHLEDPVGEIIESRQLENGLNLKKVRVPIGVIGVIYESRPNVTVDVACLALKTGNCAIMRGGKETLRTNLALMHAIQMGLEQSGLPPSCLQLIKAPHRSHVKQLLKLDSYIDMIIPRGGEQLHRFCKKESLIPVITGGIGICHLFADKTADLNKALDVIENAKTQRPSVCNALDTLLVHKEIAHTLLPAVVKRLKAKGVSFRLDPKAYKILPKDPCCHTAQDTDWQTEWLSLVLGIKVVEHLEEAIEHVQRYSSRHSDGILTGSPANAHKFQESIDSAVVYVNASTRFTDGGEFGFGAEVAVSTQKLHARGPMGLKELTTYKWVVEGSYHIRS